MSPGTEDPRKRQADRSDVRQEFARFTQPEEQVREAFAGLTNFDATEIETALKATAAQLGVKVGALVHRSGEVD